MEELQEMVNQASGDAITKAVKEAEKKFTERSAEDEKLLEKAREEIRRLTAEQPWHYIFGETLEQKGERITYPLMLIAFGIWLTRGRRSEKMVAGGMDQLTRVNMEREAGLSQNLLEIMGTDEYHDQLAATFEGMSGDEVADHLKGKADEIRRENAKAAKKKS